MSEPRANTNLNDSAVLLETVRSIWCEVLAVSEIEDDANFLDAGGNSLLLVALVEKLSDACGHALKTRDVLHARTVRGQAELLARQPAGPAGNAGNAGNA